MVLRSSRRIGAIVAALLLFVVAGGAVAVASQEAKEKVASSALHHATYDSYSRRTAKTKLVVTFAKKKATSPRSKGRKQVCAPTKSAKPPLFRRAASVKSQKQCRLRCKKSKACRGFDFRKIASKVKNGKNKFEHVCRLWKTSKVKAVAVKKGRTVQQASGCFTKQRKRVRTKAERDRAERDRVVSAAVNGILCPEGSGGDESCRIRLTAFGSDVARGYRTSSVPGGGGEDEEEKLLYDDLVKAAMFVSRQVIKRNAGVSGYDGGYSCGIGRGGGIRRKGGAGPPEVGDDVDDYETNTQEEDVDEGDVMKSDGSYVYAAFGDYVAMWDIEGDYLSAIKMAGDVSSLLLHEGRLLVVVTAPYNWRCTTYSKNKRAALPGDNCDGKGDILSSLDRTQLLIYSTEDLVASNKRRALSGATQAMTNVVDVEPISVRSVSGYFADLRSMGRYAHVMTTQGVDAYNWLEAPLERYEFPKDLTTEEYAEQAAKLAAETTIPAFCDRLLRELKDRENDDALPNLARISLFTDTWSSGEGDDDTSSNDIDEVLSENGPLNSLSLMHSMDILQQEGVGKIGVSTSGTFLPSCWSRFYLGDGTVIVAGQGSSFSWSSRRSSTATYFVGFPASDASTTPGSVGKVDGFLRDSYAMDVLGSELRVATTVRKTNWWGFWRRGRGRLLQNEESTTENYVIILDMKDEDGSSLDVMAEKGREQIGKKDETITAVRFMKDVAYVVTFERRDPFYVIDLVGEDAPQAVGELDISGFSNYLHPMNRNKTMILALGQEADDDGNIEGLKITIFDVRNPREPRDVATHVIKSEWSYSEALSEYKAVRYLMDSKRLIIPLDVYKRRNSFHGFITYYTDESGIQEECRVEHEEQYWYYWLARRSMVFKGKLMTTFGKSIHSTDMNNCTLLWQRDIEIPDTEPDP